MPIGKTNCGFQLDAGRLTQRVLFQNPVDETDHGERTQTFVDAFSVWAEVLPATTRDIERAAQLGIRADYRIVCRYREDIDDRQQMIWRGKTLTISGTPMDIQSRKIAWEIFAQEVR